MFEYRSPMKQDSDKWSPIVTSDSLFDLQSVAQSPFNVRNVWQRSSGQWMKRSHRFDWSTPIFQRRSLERREWMTGYVRVSACVVNKIIWERGESRCTPVYRSVNLIHECRSRADARERSSFDFAWHVLIIVEILPARYECNLKNSGNSLNKLQFSHGVSYHIHLNYGIESCDFKSNNSLLFTAVT